MRFVLSLFCAALPVFAFAQERVSATVRLYDWVAVFNPPIWEQRAGEQPAIMQSEVSRMEGKSDHGTDRFLLEFIPKGESFDAWSELYAITAERPLNATPVQFIGAQLDIYASACTNYSYQLLHDVADWAIVVILCEAYTADPSNGEVAVMSFVVREDTLIKHYYHKRGPAFAMADLATWPMDKDDVLAAAQHLAELKLSKAQD